MTELERYLAEEIATDHADGLLTRREAMRRLGLLGLTAVAASSLITACSNDRSSTVTPTPTLAPTNGGGASADAAAALPTTPITFAGPESRTLQAAWAAPATTARGAILVIHENRGLNDHIRNVAGRFAAVGYAALALDLLSEEGGTAALGDPANATAALNNVPPGRFVADMRAALDELGRRAPGARLGAIGFCFGGGMIWQLVLSKDPRIAAAAPFYGPLPEGADFTGSKTAVLAVYGERDARVNASRPAAEAALTKAGVTHELVTYPGADHAFFNDTGPRYNADAAGKAWSKVLDWFGRHVAGPTPL